MGLFEILLIAVVTLLVVGPERMPEAVRSVALTIGRVKRMFNNARDEIEKHVGADEIRQQLHNEAVMDSLAKVKHSLSGVERDPEQVTESDPEKILDQIPDDEGLDMPWTEEEYEKIQRAHQQQEAESDNTIHNENHSEIHNDSQNKSEPVDKHGPHKNNPDNNRQKTDAAS